jgi:hypothetical protein
MSLYAAGLTGRDPYSFWQGLQLPDYVVLNVKFTCTPT